ELRVVKGAICSIAEPASPEIRLGDLLLERGQITPRQRDDAVRIQGESSRPLGEVLETMGWIGADELTEALRVQGSQRLVRLLDLQQPESAFVEMAEPYRPAAGGRAPSMPGGEGIDALVYGRLHGYLRHPYLTSQIPSYLTDTEL